MRETPEDQMVVKHGWHHDKMRVLDRIEKAIRNLVETRPKLYQYAVISSSVPYIVDYRNRKFIYLYSASTFTVVVPSLGNVNIIGQAWNNISFDTSLYLYTTSSASTPILVLCTDDSVSSGDPGSSSPSSNTATPNPANATSTGVGVDTVFSWGSGTQQVNTLYIQNKTITPLWYDFDQAASHGSFFLAPGDLQVWQRPLTVLHLFTDAAQPIDGTSANNIVVEAGE
jgi:hypothetical protein